MKIWDSTKRETPPWLGALAVMTAVSSSIYLTTFFIDGGAEVSMLKLLFEAENAGAFEGLPEVVAALLGVAVTVVAIVVELAANRYTPRITQLFVHSATNRSILALFVVTALLCIWVSLTGASREFVPKWGVVVTVFAITACVLLLLPYFAFVFHFLDPINIINRMVLSSLVCIDHAVGRRDAAVFEAKKGCVRGIEQLADVALNAIEHKDKGICMHAVDGLGVLARDYLARKTKLPDAWFRMEDELRDNADFVSMDERVLSDVESRRFWVEMKILRQYQMLYGETLNKMRDINYLIASNTRKIAERAMEEGQKEVTDLSVKFFNTFLRFTINGRDVRTAYNVLNQYRRLAEQALRLEDDETAAEIGRRFKYYGQLGFSMGLPFVLETTAYDLCALVEAAFEIRSDCHDELLGIFLELDKEAEENHELEASLRGVRKAQIKLAGFYLDKGARALAKAIQEDMQRELPSRLRSIRWELESIKTEDFWEISDRGVNFDYLEPKRRAMLDEFFGWFDDSLLSSDSQK